MTTEEIRHMLKKHKLTHEALARRLNVSVCTVSRWVTGKARPSRMACALLATYATRLEEHPTVCEACNHTAEAHAIDLACSVCRCTKFRLNVEAAA